MEKYMQVDSMNNYCEQIVKKKMSPQTVSGIVIGLILVTIIVFVSVYLSTYFGWLVPVALLMFGLGAYLIYYIIVNSGVEYEYTFVMGELRIDRIKGKARRKRITVFDVKSIDKMDKLIDPETGKRNIDISKHSLVLRAAINETDPSTYYVIIHDKIRQKPAVLLFCPDERTMSMIQPYFSIALKKKFFMAKNEEKKKAAESKEKNIDVKKTETKESFVEQEVKAEKQESKSSKNAKTSKNKKNKK